MINNFAKYKIDSDEQKEQDKNIWKKIIAFDSWALLYQTIEHDQETERANNMINKPQFGVAC